MNEPAKGQDFIGNIRRKDAAAEAQQRAVDPAPTPQRPRRATKPAGVGGYTGSALAKETEQLSRATKGTRNDVLNTAAFNLGQLVQPGGLDFDTVASELTKAALASGLTRKELERWNLPDRAIKAGMLRLRDIAEITSNATYVSTPNSYTTRTPISAETRNGSVIPTGDDDDGERRVFLQPLDGVKTRVPMWVWEYGGYGRIMLGALTMFAGKPAAGKSTAVRWFASAITNGTLPGVWYGNPMRIGVYSPEEGVEDTLVPSLQVHGADMSMVSRVGVLDADAETGLMSLRDEARLTKTLLDSGIRALFVDPVMQTFDGSVTDGHKNVETRAHLMPYVRIAQAINGLVICVHHLRKESASDVMLAMQGSSAFGEIPRCVFGFAAVGDGSNIMEQVKNSAGPTGLKLDYRLMVERTEADDGQVMELPRFEIKGETELSITDLGGARGDEDVTTSTADALWLERYLQIEQPAASKSIKDQALKQADISVSRLHRARQKLKVQIISTPKDDAPHTTSWALPGYRLPGSF